MIDGLFGSLFGGGGHDCPSQCIRVSSAGAANVQIHSNMFTNTNLFMREPMTALPAGIFWERTGGKTYCVVIRREPEVVIDLSWIGAHLARHDKISETLGG